MIYYDLKSKKVIEAKESSGLKFLYDNLFGRILLKIMTSKCVANIYAYYMNSSLSKWKIDTFIKQNNIDMDDYETCAYKSFNSFFTRKIKQGKRPVEDGDIAICDAKLSAYEISDDLKLNIKNSIYTVNELIQEDANDFKGGYALVYRLAVDDYHHYIFPCDGKILSNKKIDGTLHTVQPIALKKFKVFSENAREVTMLDTEKYGKIAYIEIGAMLIGKIVNEDINEFKKGDEKGHFEFGGSTIVLLFTKDKIKINEDVLKNTKEDIETIIKMGESIGR